MCESRYILPQKPQPELRLSSPFDFRPGMRRAAGGIHIFDSTRHGNESSLPGKNHTRHIAAGQTHAIFFRLPDETMEGSDHKPVLLQNLPNMAGCIIKRERPHIIRKRGKIGGKFRKVNVVDFKRPGCHLNLVVGGTPPEQGFTGFPRDKSGIRAIDDILQGHLYQTFSAPQIDGSYLFVDSFDSCEACVQQDVDSRAGNEIRRDDFKKSRLNDADTAADGVGIDPGGAFPALHFLYQFQRDAADYRLSTAGVESHPRRDRRSVSAEKPIGFDQQGLRSISSGSDRYGDAGSTAANHNGIKVQAAPDSKLFHCPHLTCPLSKKHFLKPDNAYRENVSAQPAPSGFEMTSVLCSCATPNDRKTAWDAKNEIIGRRNCQNIGTAA